MMVTSLPQPSAPASAATAQHDLIGRDYAANGWILRRILAPSRTPIDGTKKNAAASTAWSGGESLSSASQTRVPGAHRIVDVGTAEAEAVTFAAL